MCLIEKMILEKQKVLIITDFTKEYILGKIILSMSGIDPLSIFTDDDWEMLLDKAALVGKKNVTVLEMINYTSNPNYEEIQDSDIVIVDITRQIELGFLSKIKNYEKTIYVLLRDRTGKYVVKELLNQ